MQRRERERPGGDTDEVIEPIQFRPASAAPALPRLRLPWLHLLLGLIVVVGLWGAWYVMTARSVHIVTEPADASVRADELIAPQIGGHWVLRPGQRRFVVEAPGFRPFADDITVSDEALQTHTVTLVPLPGELNITLTPVTDAVVTIDGDRTAAAPGVIEDLESGPHEVTVQAPRYLPFTKVVDIEGRGIRQDLSVALNPAWADVAVESQPAGAIVTVDGQEIGKTPLSAELLQGERAMMLALPGYKTWQRTLNIVAGSPVSLPPVILALEDGFIDIATTPTGASVTVDKEYKGRSPLRVSVNPEGSHRVAVSKTGYKGATRNVEVASGATAELAFELQAELAAVQVIAIPDDAELLIDGVSRGSANQTIKLPTHEHRLEVRKPGYVSYTTEITPRTGVRKRISVRLKTPSEAQAAAGATAGAPSGSAKTFVGSDMKLFSGGTVKMGSSRRDPHRRANEVLREATLTRPFYLGVREVTNGEYRRFLANHRLSPINGVDVDGDNHPVIKISWNNAALYCNWLSRKDSLPEFYQIKNGRVLGINPAATGYRLPTEAEWAWVARTSPRSEESFEFPWAGKFPPRGRSGNYADESASAILGATIPDYNDGFAVTAPGGSYPANLRGLQDIGGNVSEWMNDYYVAAPSGAASTDPIGPAQGESHVVRGASWAHATATELRLAYRDYGNDARDDVGFRLARYAR